MAGLNLFRRLFGTHPSGADHKRQERQEEDRKSEEFMRQEHEYLQRMEDEIAVMMRERRNGH